jgi:hypothetical protein
VRVCAVVRVRASRLQKLIESLPLPVVRTNDLEDRLTELAVSLGIVIDVPHHVIDIERDVRQRYPSARVRSTRRLSFDRSIGPRADID